MNPNLKFIVDLNHAISFESSIMFCQNSSKLIWWSISK